MISKTLKILSVGILAVVLLANLISATITFTSVPTLSTTGTSVNISIQSDKNETIAFSGLTSITENGKTITFNPLSAITLVANTPQTIGLNYNIPSDFEFLLGKSYSTSLTATGSNSSAVTSTLSFGKLNYCSLGDKGDLDLDVDINHLSGFGDDDDEWYPGDEIKLEVTVDNTGNDKIEDIVIEWGLYNPETGDWVIDDDESKFDLKSGKDITKEITFNVNADDLNEDTENYILYVKAYSDDEGEDSECMGYSQDITISIESDFVILSDIKISPETVQCDSEVQLTADVWNVGDTDQDDVYVRIYNPILKVDQKVTIGDIDALDNKKLNVNVNIPEGLTEKTYEFQLEVYDEDDDVYINDNDDESRYLFYFKVEGNCGTITSDAFITANLQSGGKAGEELVIKATIQNTGDKTATYTVSATNYNSWATLTSIEPTSITLDSNEQRDVLIKLNVNKDALGDKIFNIEAKTGDSDQEKITQSVAVTIQKSGGFSLPGITGFSITNNNWYLWGIGLINVILVIIIIIVAMRIARS